MPSLRFLASLLLVTTASCWLVKGVPNTDLKDASCNPETWVGDAYGRLVHAVLNTLIGCTPLDPAYLFSYADTDGTYTVYGFSSCGTHLAPWDCTTCLAAAQQTTYSMCPYAVGATVELVDCIMRYENYDF